jgi:hypothetical protein
MSGRIAPPGIAESVSLAGEALYDDINRRHGELPAHDVADRRFMATGGGNSGFADG